ncbi:trichohyalin-like isoform X3 [Pieris napi]|uniref:trichohyalin-like isoform X3 n=1 Tax=Pieris napi TaxID=78633 RepID=UPI001FBB46E0|nr:trichohyalin-like isoform X3 [Pieris napi]
MQNFHSGDFNNVSENERKDKSNLHTHMKNLDDSFNDDTYNGKAQAQVDKDVKYRHDLKEQCEDNFKRAQNDYEESRAETSRIQQAGNYIMSEQYQQEFERERKLKDKDELNTRMCTRMVAHEVERQDREDVITVKHEDEDREKLRREDVMVYEKKQEDKRELSDGLLTQIEENKQSVRDEKQRELNFSDRANALMELEDEREEERARRKKERDDQYFSDLRQQIADNAVRRQKQKEQDAM